MAFKDLLVVRIIASVPLKIWIGSGTALLTCFIVYCFYGSLMALLLFTSTILCMYFNTIVTYFEPIFAANFDFVHFQLFYTKFKIISFIIRKYRNIPEFMCQCLQCTKCHSKPFTFDPLIMSFYMHSGSDTPVKLECSFRRLCSFMGMLETWAIVCRM